MASPSRGRQGDFVSSVQTGWACSFAGSSSISVIIIALVVCRKHTLNPSPPLSKFLFLDCYNKNSILAIAGTGNLKDHITMLCYNHNSVRAGGR